MAIQTIREITLKGLYDEAIKKTDINANNLILQERFRLGNGYCEKDQFDNEIISEINNFQNCELINYVNARIEEGPDEEFEINLPEIEEI